MAKRYYGLDFLRSFAMLLGLLVHAPIIYILPEIPISMGINDIPPAELWSHLVLDFITRWRMQVFFLLSGFFSLLLVEKRGLFSFIGDRFIRILLTFILFSTLFDYFDGSFDGTLDHLWFLYYLSLHILFFVFCYRLGIVDFLLRPVFSVYLFFFLLFLLLFYLPVGVVLSQEIILPPIFYTDIQLLSLFYYFIYFFSGIFLYRHREFLHFFMGSRFLLFLFLLSLFMYFCRFLFELELFTFSYPFGSSIILVLFAFFIDGLNSFFWCFLLIGLSLKFLDSSSRFITWLVELSYPIYLFHFHIIVFITLDLYESGYNQLDSFFISIPLCFVMCILVYYICVKYTPLSWFLNGYKKSFFKLGLFFR